MLRNQLRLSADLGSREALRQKVALVAAFAVRMSKKASLAAEFERHCMTQKVRMPRQGSSTYLPLIRATFGAAPVSTQTRLAQTVENAVKSGWASKKVFEAIKEYGPQARFRRKVKLRT